MPCSENSIKIGPIESKKQVSMVLFWDLCCKAFVGRSALTGNHTEDSILVSGSMMNTGDSSPHTSLSNKKGSFLNLSRLCSQKVLLACFCSSLRILGMNLAVHLDILRSFLMIFCADDQAKPASADTCLMLQCPLV